MLLHVPYLIALTVSFTPYSHTYGKDAVSGGRHFEFMQIKHFIGLLQRWTPSSNQDNVLSEVYAKFGGPTMDIAKGIKICNKMGPELPH